METDLHNVIKKGNILNNVHKQYIMYQLLKATAYLHSGEVIHRDQKPSNVLLDSYCLVKLCDFGLARSLKGRSKYQNGNKINCKTLLPALTEYVATRWYRAPEILLACHDYTKGVDIWSLGCILGEMLIGTPLFPGTSTLDQIERIMGGLPKPSSEDLASVKSPYSSSILQKARIRKRRSLDQLLANEDKTAIDLLYKMLHFNPHKRITALEALKHPYVRRFYCPNEIMIMNHHVTPPLDDNVQLTVSEYRDRLYQMISSKKTNTPIKSMIQNGVTNKNDTLKEKNNIVTTIPKPISYSSCSSHTKKQSTIRTVKNHETSEDKTPEQHLHYEKQKLMNQQKQSENNKNDNKTNSSQNHVVCVQVNLLHQESQNSSTNDHHQQHQQQHKVTISKPKLTHTPSTSITGTNKIITTMTPISLANSNNVGIHTNGNTTTSNNHLVHNHENVANNVYDYNDKEDDYVIVNDNNNNNNYDVLPQYASSSSSLPTSLSSISLVETTAAEAVSVMMTATTTTTTQSKHYQLRSPSNVSLMNSKSPIIHCTPVIRSNSVNCKVPIDYKASRRYSTVTPSYYPNQLISKSDMPGSITSTNQQSHSQLDHRSSTSNSSNSISNCYDRRRSYGSSLQSGSNSRVTTSNFYYFSAIDSEKYPLLPNYGNSFENIMFTPQRAIDLDYSELNNENRHISSQPENLSHTQDYEYLDEKNWNMSLNGCVTENIDLNEYHNRLLKVSPSKSTQSPVNIQNYMKEKVTESTHYKTIDVISGEQDNPITNHNNMNNKESMLNCINSMKYTTNNESHNDTTLLVNQQKVGNLQQNKKINDQSNYRSLSSMNNINQKLKIIQGSTNIQNSMFQSKISSSLNNLQAKLQNGHHQREQEQGRYHGNQSNHNGYKYNRTSNQSSNSYNYQKMKKDENDTSLNYYQKVTTIPLKHTLSTSSPISTNQQTLSIRRHHSELSPLNSYDVNNQNHTTSNLLHNSSNDNNSKLKVYELYKQKHKMNSDNSLYRNENHLDKLPSNQQIHNRFISLSAVNHHQNHHHHHQTMYQSRLPKFNSTKHSTSQSNLNNDSVVLCTSSNTAYSSNHQIFTNSHISRPNVTITTKPIRLNSEKITNFIDQYQSTYLTKPSYIQLHQLPKYNSPSSLNHHHHHHHRQQEHTEIPSTSDISININPNVYNTNEYNVIHSNDHSTVGTIQILRDLHNDSSNQKKSHISTLSTMKSTYSRK
ncbi:Mitogen-activated protein kinase 15 [Schistosoma japonicum]|uniref:Mitogen-activated protein kinase 15 n=1 Tax=Schistosoma japonicum TaxID=6182 RepID=A0A4Z2D521_SCHJA|nr:Mitogen-activated protein kinase 15 [Schistosoma japonicum]